jgi:UDP-3-O-[3-hydroxymyristoyl] glucosamine N-acyltransferase
MKFPAPVSVSWMANLINATPKGNETLEILGINEINNVQAGDIVFVDHPKYYNKCIASNATIIIINNAVDCPGNKCLLICEQPFEAYLKIVNHFSPFVPLTETISKTASIGNNTIVMPGAIIGNNVRIGNHCIIHPNVTLHSNTIIGNNVIIQAGTVIGSDAFYYNRKTDRPVQYKRMDSCGKVIIEDWVEIGANCTIDRGVTADTIIGEGTKFDNMIHIAHDVVIGKNCLFAAQVAIAGCTIIEDEVTVWGQVAVNKTLRIGKSAVILGQSGVGENIAPGKSYFGSPAQEAKEHMKDLVWIKRIPELWKKMKD